MKLTVLIPCFNEKKTIKRLIKKVEKINIKKQVIIIDDGSNDGTVEILRKIKKKNIKLKFNKINKGKGAAIKSS